MNQNDEKQSYESRASKKLNAFDGEYVLYTDHLAAIAEKDRDYGKIFHLQLDVIKEKDKHIKELVLLCLDNGTISRGMACTYLGCAREDLDELTDKMQE